MDIREVGRGCVLLDDRAYVVSSMAVSTMLQLSEELAHVKGTVFEARALYYYYGLNEGTISILKQLPFEGEFKVVLRNSSMRITRVSEHFYRGEWIQERYNYNYNYSNYNSYNYRKYETPHEDRHYHENDQLLCN